MEMVNINLFAGPCTGKSATAGGLFHLMKVNDENVEYVQEYAKDLTYGKDDVKLSDQILLLGKQHHRMFRMRDQVEYIIHDSPFITGMIYANEDLIPLKEFEALIIALYKRYSHINIFLKRNPNKEYQSTGRNQTKEEAEAIDERIKDWLRANGIEFYEVEIGDNTLHEIYEIIKNNDGSRVINE